MEKKIVIGIPCYNEAPSIEKVVEDFRRELPTADILVVDNNSKDQTAQLAKKAGAIVICEKRQGKGFAVQRIFQEFSGDALVLVDGDDTYIASDVHKLLALFEKGEAEMVVGNRIHEKNKKTFSLSHWYGNKFLTTCLNFSFGTRLSDMESGFRVIDGKFVLISSLLAGGFNTEPEITIQALEKGMRIKEVQISLQTRKAGSSSKLNAVKDGIMALYTVVSLFRDYKPMNFFALFSGVLFVLGMSLGWYGVRGYFSSGLVDHLPALVVANFLVLASFISFIAGLILSSIKRRHNELVVILNRKKK